MISTAGHLKLRGLEERDVGRLVEVFAECLPRERWEAEDFRRFVRKARRSNNLKVLSDDRGGLHGAVLYELAGDECRVRRVCVPDSPDERRRGHATYMVASLCGRQSPLPQTAYTARVRGDYISGLNFFSRGGLGFVLDRYARHIYRDGMEGYTFRHCRVGAAQRRPQPAMSGG